jgi:hypothetical protein
MAAPAVFISAKSEDYAFAREVFALLNGQGIPCFFCDESLIEGGDVDYKNAIDSALDSAPHLIVVTSSRANAESKWVKYEWDTFYNELLSGRKKGNLLVVTCGDLKPGELPLALRQKQVLRFDTERDRIARYLPGCAGAAAGTSTPKSAGESPGPDPALNRPPAGVPEGAVADAGARARATPRRGEIKAHFRGCSFSLAVVFGIVVVTGSSLFYVMRSPTKHEGLVSASLPPEPSLTAASAPMETPSPTAAHEAASPELKAPQNDDKPAPPEQKVAQTDQKPGTPEKTAPQTDQQTALPQQNVAMADRTTPGGLVFERIIQSQTTFIQHEATERQRKIAQANALALAKRVESHKNSATKLKKNRYIAVDIEKNEQTSPKAKKVVMVWDIQSESLVGNTVYDLPDPPAVGRSIAFSTFSAEYVGGAQKDSTVGGRQSLGPTGNTLRATHN